MVNILVLRSPYECRKKARKLVKKYIEETMRPKQLVWPLRAIVGVGLTEKMFEQVLAGFEGTTKIGEIRDIVAEYDIFGEFKGTKED